MSKLCYPWVNSDSQFLVKELESRNGCRMLIQIPQLKNAGWITAIAIYFAEVTRSGNLSLTNLELEKSSEDLLQDGSDVLEWQRTELVLLEEVVQILLQHLKHQTGVVLVLKALVCSHKVELVCILLAESWQDTNLQTITVCYQCQNK